DAALRHPSYNPGELLRLQRPGRRGGAQLRGGGGPAGLRGEQLMDNLYRDFILEHYRSPHNKGYLDPHDLHFADSNPTCGDEMSMTLRLDESGDAIADVAFDGRGCAISQAAASILTDGLRGLSLDEVQAMDPKQDLDELGVPI